VGRLVGGWSVSGIQRYESGQPFAICCSNGGLGIPGYAGAIRYDQVPGSSLLSPQYLSGNFNPVIDPMLNINALHDPNAVNDAPNPPSGIPYVLGTMPRVTGQIRMPWYTDEDFNILKRTKITESTDILLEANILDAFNRHVFNRPTDFNINDTAGFGKIPYGSQLLGPRVLQLQLKVEF
jgi:hypothetical protein